MFTLKARIVPGIVLLIAGYLFFGIVPADLEAEQSGDNIKYVVKKGDTLYKLGKRFNTTPEEILLKNSVLVPENLPIGSTLVLPIGNGVITHTILKGETLWRISWKYDTDVDAIASKNYIEDPNMIYEGDVLSIPERKTKDELMALSGKIVELFNKRDFGSLSEYVHPSKGVRFSPYGHVDINTDLIFYGPKVSKFATDPKIYTWGAYDGSGEPIKLNPKQYIDKFVYNVDFINSDQIGYNKVIGTGNILVNQFDVYPSCNIVEYYVPGSEKYGFMDWNSLRLVYEEYNGRWFLVGIIHDQWTI